MPFESPDSIKRLATEEFVSYPLSGLFSTNGWRRGFSSSRERIYAGGLFFSFFWVCCFFLSFFFFLLVYFRKYCSVSRSGRFYFFSLPQFSFSCTDKHRVHIYTNTHTHTHNLSFVSPRPPPAPCVWKQTQQTSRLPGSKGILGNHGWEKARVKVKTWWDLHHHNTPSMPRVHKPGYKTTGLSSWTTETEDPPASIRKSLSLRACSKQCSLKAQLPVEHSWSDDRSEEGWGNSEGGEVEQREDTGVSSVCFYLGSD